MMLFRLTSATTEETAPPRQGQLPEALLLRVAEEDPAAFEELYRRTDRAVFAFALSILRDRQDAEDVMQETYLRIRTHAGAYRPGGNPMAWVLTIAKNLSLMRLRGAGRLIPVENLPEEDAAPGPETSVQDRMVLSAALAELEDPQRQIVLLHAVTGLKHREIAALLDLPLNSVLSQYTRGLKKLKRYLEEK